MGLFQIMGSVPWVSTPSWSRLYHILLNAGFYVIYNCFCTVSVTGVAEQNAIFGVCLYVKIGFMLSSC